MQDPSHAVTGNGDHAGWTIVTVTYNNAEQLTQHWSGGIPEGARWIVVDNASSDGSARLAEQFGAEVVPLQQNIGFGAANNVGYALAHTDHVGFVNPDVTVEWQSLPALAEIASRLGGLVSPQLVNADGTLQPNGRGWPFLLNKVLNRTAHDSRVDHYRLYADPDEVRDVVWLMGAVVLGERRVFDRLGGPWDDAFFVYYEDADICLRARALGIPSAVVGESRWLHGWERATSSANLHAWRREIPSMLKFYTRYPALLSPVVTRTTRRLERGRT